MWQLLLSKLGQNLGNLAKILVDDWKPLLYLVVLVVVFVCRRYIQKRTFESDDMLPFIWENVGITLTFIYVLGTIDFVFNQGAILHLTVSDIKVIVVAAVLTLTYLAVSRLTNFSKRKERKPRNTK